MEPGIECKFLARDDKHNRVSMVVRLARGAEYPELGEDESYTLDVTPAGATVNAATAVGALRALETFTQAIVPGAAGFEIPAMHVEDRPRFAWRGSCHRHRRRPG